MKRKELYIIRHGQTDFNKNKIIQGRGVNSNLNEEGRSQALRFFEKYQHLPFQKIYTSTLVRTHQTVAHFLKQGIPHESHAALDEFDWGIHEGMQTSAELKKSFDEITEAWKNGFLNQGPPQGETPIEVMNRQKAFWEKWLETEEDLVLICMHGRCMRVFLSWLTGRGLEAMDTFDHSNTCLYHGWWDGEKLILEKENDTTHLD